jgi:hypothetical protein
MNYYRWKTVMFITTEETMTTSINFLDTDEIADQQEEGIHAPQNNSIQGP